MGNALRNMLVTSLIINSFSCNKNGEKMRRVEVVEFKTNTPISNATIDFRKLGDFAPYCVCYWPEVIFTKQTDANGICEVTENEFNRANGGIFISKENFWTNESYVIENRYQLDFIGQVNLHLVTTKRYPEKALMNILCKGELATSATNNGYIFLPYDSTFGYTAFGGQINSFTWEISDSNKVLIESGGPIQKEILKSGITDVEIKF